jgi:hypothetical protein
MSTNSIFLSFGRCQSNSNITRVVDANVVHLEQEIPLNGSFKIYIFPGKPSLTSRAVQDFAQTFTKRSSFFSSYLDPDLDSVLHHESHNPHSHFFTFCTIFARKWSDIEISKEFLMQRRRRMLKWGWIKRRGVEGLEV